MAKETKLKHLNETARVATDHEDDDEVVVECIEQKEVKSQFTLKRLKNDLNYLDKSIENFENQRAIVLEQIEEVEGIVKKRPKTKLGKKDGNTPKSTK